MIAPLRKILSRMASPKTRAADKPCEIVVLAPNAWFPSMLAGPAIVAKALQNRGHVVEVVSCKAARKTCTVMDGMAPLDERPARQFCDECTSQSADYLSRYRLKQRWDTEFLSAADESRLRALCDEIGPDPRAFRWDDVPIGILATGNLSAIWKRDLFTDLTDDARVRLRIMVEDGLRWYLIAQAIASRMSPKILIYYAEYYPEVIVGLVLQRHGTKVVPVVHSGLNGNDFRKLQIVDSMPQVLEMPRRMAAWPAWRDLPLSSLQVREVSDDVVTRLLGNSVISFSPGLNEGDQLERVVARLKPDLKTIVVFTSSDDELNNTKMQRDIFGMPLSTKGDVFPDQASWLRDIADFVAANESHQMVVRLHPRLAANARSASVADYRNQVDAVRRDDCDRIHVVLPESRCSSYELAQRADLVLTSWSTIGLECVRLGLPVMMGFRGTGLYPTDGFLNYCTDPEAYFDRVRRGVPIHVDDLLHAFRFTHMFLCAPAVDLSGLVSRYDDPALPDYKMSDAVASDIQACIVGDEIMHERRLAEQKRHATPSAADEERAAVARAIRRLIHVLAFREDAAPAHLERLVFRHDETMKLHPDTLYVGVSADSREIELIFAGKRTTRSSTALSNLVSFHNELEAPFRRRSAA